MQGRSWMAALTLAAGLVPALSPKAGAGDTSAAASASGVVKLVLQIRGLGSRGCDVEIRPGHEGCQFHPVRQHVGYRGEALITLKDVTTTNADRDCAVAITIHEPGQSARTVRRGLRLSPKRISPSSAHVLNCFLNSPSKLAQAEQMAAKARERH